MFVVEALLDGSMDFLLRFSSVTLHNSHAIRFESPASCEAYSHDPVT
jgi:hypothetical protein